MNKDALIGLLLFILLFAGCTSNRDQTMMRDSLSERSNSTIDSSREKYGDSRVPLEHEYDYRETELVSETSNSTIGVDETRTEEFRMLNRLIGTPKWFGEKTIKNVLDFIENRNAKELKKLFSVTVQADTGFDELIGELFGFIDGEILSYQRVGGSESTSISDGIGHRECYNGYEVVTDKEKYLFLVLEYLEDEQNPDNVGIYTLCVMKKEDQNRESIKPQDVKAPGIFIREFE